MEEEGLMNYFPGKGGHSLQREHIIGEPGVGVHLELGDS